MFATFCGNSNSKIFYLSDKSNEVYLKFRCYGEKYCFLVKSRTKTIELVYFKHIENILNLVYAFKIEDTAS